MKKPNVFIRGIYSTALTKMFLDEGYPIIYPSKRIQKLFDIPFREDDTYAKDITISERWDKQGISIMFKKEMWDELKENNFKDFPLNKERFPNLITFHSKFHKNSIYRGIVVKSNKKRNFSKVRLIPESIGDEKEEMKKQFYTTFGHFKSYLPEGKEGIFQVSHEDYGKTTARLTSFYTVPGDLVVINPYSKRVLISKKLHNPRVKKRLFNLGKELQRNKKYGFIFRTAAKLASDEEIKDEVNQLEEELIEIQKKAAKIENQIGEIHSNFRTINLIFTNPIKNKFNSIRKEIVDTIDFHHNIKSNPSKSKHMGKFGANETALLDYSEALMKKMEEKESKKKIEGFYLDQYFRQINRGQKFYINHLKLTGKVLHLSPGRVFELNVDPDEPLQITLKRKLKEGGIYDGLGTPIERGDYSISKFVENNWFYVSEYFSRKGELKGKYFNINTPTEITNQTIQYVDLDIDVVENVARERKIIDKEKLDVGLDLDIISQEVYDKALVIAENIVEDKINIL